MFGLLPFSSLYGLNVPGTGPKRTYVGPPWFVFTSRGYGYERCMYHRFLLCFLFKGYFARLTTLCSSLDVFLLYFLAALCFNDC